MLAMRKTRPETTTISIRIERQTLDFLREEARRLSHQWKRDMGYADLIRDAVSRIYPKEEFSAGAGPQNTEAATAKSGFGGFQQAEKRETGVALEEETKSGR